MKEMHYNDKVIKVFDTDISNWPSQNYTKHLYADTAFYLESSATYYTEEGDGTVGDGLLKIGFFEELSKAEEEFNILCLTEESENCIFEFKEKVGDIWEDSNEMLDELQCLLPGTVDFGFSQAIPFSSAKRVEISNEAINISLDYVEVDEGIQLIDVNEMNLGKSKEKVVEIDENDKAKTLEQAVEEAVEEAIQAEEIMEEESFEIMQ